MNIRNILPFYGINGFQKEIYFCCFTKKTQNTTKVFQDISLFRLAFECFLQPFLYLPYT